MEAAGVKILVPSSDMAVVGLTEVMYRARTIVRAANRLKGILKHLHPHLLILIDYPDFNLYMARFAKQLKVPVLYYISPQVWAWRRGRVKKIAKRVDRMAVILPFEAAFYRRWGVHVDYVGHPLLDAFERRIGKPPSDIPFPQAGSPSGIRNPQPAGPHPVIGILPGSRKEEIRSLLPVMIRSVEILKARYSDIQCLLPLAKTIEPEFIEPFIRKSALKIEVLRQDIYGILDRCHIALVASGTATLEVAFMGIPMVVVYKVTPFSYWIGRMLIKVPYIGLANLVAGERVVPELVQDDATPERLADEALTLLEDEDIRGDMIEKLKNIKRRLGRGGASERTARIAIEMMR